MILFLTGLVTAGYLVAGLFFLKFWARTRDPLFAIFAIAFWMLALDEVLRAGLALPIEERGWTFLVRLAAFSLLAIAIAYKNAAARRADTPPD
jgi:hypothetical protein